MNGKKMTRDEIDIIIESYKSGTKIQDIADGLERNRQTIINVLEREGVRSVKHREGKKNVSEVKCPNCRATGHYKGAKFCYKCGADIRTEADILRERLGKLVADFVYLPDSIRDNAYSVVQDAIDYLRKV